jgi:hypothetical protein
MSVELQDIPKGITIITLGPPRAATKPDIASQAKVTLPLLRWWRPAESNSGFCNTHARVRVEHHVGLRV